MPVFHEIMLTTATADAERRAGFFFVRGVVFPVLGQRNTCHLMLIAFAAV
jgi:hypothetical protein